jgi:NAD(P)-dependent dehydrogenase (short-subunit alcohol dehydrogenase family)
VAFEGKVALVTGGGSGMGRLAARQLASAGARVAIVDVNEEGLRETARKQSEIAPYPLDVTDEQAVSETVARIEGELGPIDRVLNAAAIMPTDLITNQDMRLINRVMEINYCGTVNVTMAVLPGMLERGRGDLVNFASIAGWLPAIHFGAYNASKFAVVAFTEVLYHENRKRGVRFACVCPPPVATPLLDQAKSEPKVLADIKPLPPEQVLAAIEKCLERGRLMVYPDWTSRVTQRVRRWMPGILWRFAHKIEGI